MALVYVVLAVADGAVSLYLAWRYRDFRKFLAGAFLARRCFSAPVGNELCRIAASQR